MSQDEYTDNFNSLHVITTVIQLIQFIASLVMMMGTAVSVSGGYIDYNNCLGLLGLAGMYSALKILSTAMTLVHHKFNGVCRLSAYVINIGLNVVSFVLILINLPVNGFSYLTECLPMSGSDNIGSYGFSVYLMFELISIMLYIIVMCKDKKNVKITCNRCCEKCRRSRFVRRVTCQSIELDDKSINGVEMVTVDI